MERIQYHKKAFSSACKTASKVSTYKIYTNGADVALCVGIVLEIVMETLDDIHTIKTVQYVNHRA